MERQAGLLLEAQKPRVVLVCMRVQAGKQVLAVVVRQLLLVGQVAVAGVEALGQEQQTADPVAVLGEVAGCVNSSLWRSGWSAQMCSTS